MVTFDCDNGVDQIVTFPVSHEQAMQRMGRAGRKFTGYGVQLYNDFQW